MLDAWQLWVIAGLVLWIVEIFTPGFVIGLFATACLAVAPFAGAGVSFKMQLLVFGVATVISAVAFYVSSWSLALSASRLEVQLNSN